jgi:penicillin amidase
VRILRNILIGLVLFALVLLTAGIGFGIWTVRRSFPQTTGEVSLPGLFAPVEVVRNDRGIPDIYAQSPQDLFYAQGFVHAQDRFWEMDFRRHITAGRLSEMFGSGQVETDKFLRVMGWRRVAQQELPMLSATTRRNLEAYTRGVNAYLADHSGSAVSLEYAVLGLQNSSYTIEPWTPVDSIAWLKAMAWDLRGNMVEEIQRSIISAKVGEVRTAQLYPPYPFNRHRPIVTQGGLADGVWDQTASRLATQAASSVPRLPAAAIPSLGSLSAGLVSLDKILGPTTSGIGSNSWVVSGAKTITGQPLLANDPHLSPSMPSIWYQMGLHCRVVSQACPYDVSGFTFSGMPGVVIGHNGKIAWGFTNLGPDVTDLVLEKVTGDSYVVGAATLPLITSKETIKVAGGDPVEITVRQTKDGPLLSDASTELTTVGQDAPNGVMAPPRGDGYGVALKWTALTPGRTMDAVDQLNTAQNWDEFRSAASLFEVPAQNLIFASTTGDIGYQTPGKIPIRQGYDGKYPALGWDPAESWSGFIPFSALPNVKNPDDGFVVTANQASVYKDYPYFLTDDWSYGARSQRIVDEVVKLTLNGKRISADQIRTLQFDSRNENASFLVPRIKDLDITGASAEALKLFDGWDYSQPANSAAAAYFNAFWRHLLVDTFDDELPTGYQPDGGDRWFEVIRNLWSAPNDPWWTDKKAAGSSGGRDAIVKRALDEATAELTSAQGGDPAKWTWGQMHTLTVRNQTLGTSGIGPIEAIFNRGPVETSGGESVVNATGWDASSGNYEVTWVPSMRMVLDLSRFDASTWVHLTGNSGHTYSANYVDQLDAWRDGTTFPFAFTKSGVAAAAVDTLTLKPHVNGM